jgi:hypothetical protein
MNLCEGLCGRRRRPGGSYKIYMLGTTSLILYGTSIGLIASTNECVSVRVFVAAFGGREGPIKIIY